MDFETHVAAHLQEEIAQVKGKSTANWKHNKKSKSKSKVDDDNDNDNDDGLDVAPPCVDDATDGGYVTESDDDSVEDIGFAKTLDSALLRRSGKPSWWRFGHCCMCIF